MKIIMGDWNARTANLENTLYGNKERKNIDKKYNTQGKTMIEFCKEEDLMIVNGRQSNRYKEVKLFSKTVKKSTRGIVR